MGFLGIQGPACFGERPVAGPSQGSAWPPLQPLHPSLIARLSAAPAAGLPIPGTQLRVVDPESLQDVPDGQQGLILARGPGVTAGYYRDDAATAKVGGRLRRGAA